jgi:hypothetical protein
MLHMKRREFITLLGGAAAWPLAAHAQQQPKMLRVGFVGMQLSEDGGFTWRCFLPDVFVARANEARE